MQHPNRYRGILSLAFCLTLAVCAPVPAAPSEAVAADAEIAAIESLLARGDDDAALPRIEALIAANATAPAQRRARLELLLARTHALGETHQDAVIAAATRAIEGFGSVPTFSDQVLQARQLRGIAWTRQRQAEQALADLGEVERVMRERGETATVAYAQVLSDLSLAQRIAADYGAALTSLDQSLAILRKQPGPDPIALATTLIRLGQTRRISGDLDRAEAAYLEALDVDRKSPDPSRRNKATVLYALGNLYRNRNQPERAIEYYAEALPVFEAIWGSASLQLSKLLNNYGNAESLRPGRGEAAVALFQRALDIAVHNRSKNPGDYLPLGNIAMVRIWQRRFIEAETGFRAMLGHLHGAPAGSENSPLFAQHGLAAALWGQGRHAEAFDAAVAAETMRQTGVREVAAGLSDQQALQFQELDYTTLDHALAIAIDSKDPRLLERAWTLATGARGQVTAIQAERIARARVDADAALQPLWQTWQAASAELERQRMATPTDPLIPARARLERAERQLAQALPQASGLAHRGIGFAALRKALPPDTSLVWLHDLRHVRPTDFANAAVDLEDPETWALVLPPDGAPVAAIRLGSTGEIVTALARWQLLLATPDGPIELVRERGHWLASRVWKPIANAISAKRVFIVAEGPLLRLPWLALPDGDGYLVERDVQFHVLNHERDLFAATADQPVRHALLAIADPRGGSARVGVRDTCTDVRSLPPLPGARREVQRIAALLDQGNDDPSVLTLVGKDASEARFRREAPHAAVLHLATHGVRSGIACDAENGIRGISLSAEASPQAADTSTALLLAAPTGADTAATADDGLLGSREISALDLSRVQWAVLAACSTAAGTTHVYEGLYGLARAFRLAGTHAVLLSLWPVDDDATAQWSEALYLARLRQHVDTPTAMHSAQRSVLAARRASGQSDHPWYWAGFIAVGDWR